MEENLEELSEQSSSMSFKLESFEGPLDLLLHLLDKKDHREVFWAEETPILISSWLQHI